MHTVYIEGYAVDFPDRTGDLVDDFFDYLDRVPLGVVRGWAGDHIEDTEGNRIHIGIDLRVSVGQV